MNEQIREYLYSNDADTVCLAVALAPDENLPEEELDEVLTRICLHSPNLFWDESTRPYLESLAKQRGVCITHYEDMAYGVPLLV